MRDPHSAYMNTHIYISKLPPNPRKNVVATPLNPWDSQSQNPSLQICLANKLMYVPISSNKSALKQTTTQLIDCLIVQCPSVHRYCFE